MICGKIVNEVYPTHTLHAPCGLDKGHDGDCSIRAYGERLAARNASVRCPDCGDDVFVWETSQRLTTT